ncbi:putative ADP-ribosylation factor GTPase-activating protein AGD14 [Bienertia sinuspersici]
MATNREVERNEKIIRGLMKLPPNRRCINCNSLTQRIVGDETRRASSYHSFSQSPPYDFQYEDRLNRKHQGSLTRKPGADHILYDRKAASFVYNPGHYIELGYQDRFANEGSSSRVSDYSLSSGDQWKSEPQSPNLQKNDEFASPSSDFSKEIGDGLQCRAPGTYSETFAKRDIEKAPLPRPQRVVSAGSSGSFENAMSLHSVDSGSSFDVYLELNHSNVSNQNKTFSIPSPSQLHGEDYGGLNFSEDEMAMPTPYPAVDDDLFQAQKSGSVWSMNLFHKLADSSALSHKLPQTYCSSYPISQNPPTSNTNQKLSDPSEPCKKAWVTFDLPQASPLADTKTLDSGGSGSGVKSGGISLESFYSVGPSIDLFQAQKIGSVASLDMFHKPADSSSLSAEFPQTFCSSNSISQNPPTSNPNNKLSDPSEPSKEVWATFDLPQPSPPADTKTVDSRGSGAKSGWRSLESFHSVAPSIVGLQLPEFQSPTFHSPPGLVLNPWNERLQNAATNMPSSQDFGVDGLQQFASTEGLSFPPLPSHVSYGTSSVEPVHPMVGIESFPSNLKPVIGNNFFSMFELSSSLWQSDMPWQNSGNPFDMPFDSESEAHNTLLDMSTLQAALPSMSLSSSYMGGINEPWFPKNLVVSPGGMSYMSMQAHSPQLQNVPTDGLVASVGGNPFA